MKSILPIALIAANALFSTGAQAQPFTRVAVPFAFEAMGQSFPAGEYTVWFETTSALITLESQQYPAKKMFLLAGPAQPKEYNVVLTFAVQGSDHQLRVVQYGPHASKL